MTQTTQGFLVDVDRCTGCHACTLACSTENELGWGRSWRHVVDYNPEQLPQEPVFHLSLACNHCDDAPCERACPALAIGRDAQSGAILIDDDRCLGCRYCSWACPFDAPRFDVEQGVMGKCTLCNHREGESPRPACVEACPTDALRFGDLVGSRGALGFPQTPHGPRIRFDHDRRAQSPPECSWQIPPEVRAQFTDGDREVSPRIGLSSEWPLLVFSLLAVSLVSWVAAAALGVLNLHVGIFAIAAAMAMGASTLHLGRKQRAWRAVLNLRHSWLSREVACFGSFVGLVIVLARLDWPLWPAALLGVAGLFCIDRVYDFVRAPGARPLHSADTMVTIAVVLAGLAAFPWVLFGLWALKIGSYLRRKWSAKPLGFDELGWLRLSFGFVIPLLLAWWRPPVWAEVAVASFVLGEVIDRAEFYRELRVVTPSNAARDALERSTRP